MHSLFDIETTAYAAARHSAFEGYRSFGRWFSIVLLLCIVFWPVGAVSAPAITGISPNSGPTAGGNTVVITGSGSPTILGIFFGSNSASGITILTPNSVRVTVPPGVSGPVDLIVQTSVGPAVLVNGYTYFGPPTISSVSPSSGPTTGGTAITITGTDFVNVTNVTVGGVSATGFSVVSSTQISAVVPAGTAGAANVSVTTASGTATSVGGFTYVVPPPTISSISPSSGPTAGGTSITITGTDFIGVTGVTIGGVSATSHSVVSSTQISAVVPAGSAGAASVSVTTASGTATSLAGFTYVVPPPTIGSVSPSSGPTTGGTAITITGTDFIGVSGVNIGGVSATSHSVVSSTQISAVVPAGAAGAASVSVTTASGTATSLGGFTYVVPPPTIGSVSPSSGPTTGGTIITITGTNFIGVTGVSVAGVSTTSHSVVSPTQISAVVPAGTAGAASVSVTTASGTATSLGDFTYVVPPPSITSVSPSSGSTAGGNTVIITGTGAIGVLSIHFGPNSASFVVLNSTSVRVIVPPGAPGAADITVQTPAGSATLIGGYTYVTPAPTISAVSPSSGPTAGGTTIGITGTDFTSVSGVTIGGVSATGFSVASATQITAMVPPGAAGAADVAVTTATGTATLAGGYTYVTPAPTISSVSPSSGPTAGGTAISITGTDFTSVSGVTIGGVSATGFSVASATQITAVVPAGTAGAADVAVTTATGTATLAGGYTYVTPAPTISSVSPSSGPTAGGTAISITGTDFTSVSGVTIGGVNATGFSVASATQITAVVPAGTAGAADVSVTTATGTATSLGGYTYVVPPPPAPTIVSVSPSSGPTAGGTLITITGTDFTSVSSVTIGGVSATGYTVVSATQITAVVPAGAAGAADVSVTTATGTATVSGGYTYVVPPPPAPTISSVSPSSGPITGGTAITITGTDFTSVSGVTIGGVSATGYTVVSATQITAMVPPGAAGAADVAVTNATGTATLAGGFTYIGPPPPVTTITLAPAGPNLVDAFIAEDYQVQFTAGGGSSPYTYALTSGSQPTGMSLNASTGLLSGRSSDAPGNYAFTVMARDAAGMTGQASYSLELRARPATVRDREIIVQPGFSPPDVMLSEGATGGPFSAAEIVYVDPADAGAARIVRGQVASIASMLPGDYYLQFLPDPRFSGVARVGYRLTGASGQSNTGVVTYRFSQSQESALEEVRQNEQDFLTGRQNFLAEAVPLPSLSDRRQMDNAEDANRYSLTPTAEGLRMGFSLTHEVLPDGAEQQVTVWTSGTLALQKAPGSETAGRPAEWGKFALASAGVDYRAGERLLFGAALHLHDASDPVDEDLRISGKGWLIGPYFSAEIDTNTFIDGSLLYGRSRNDITARDYRGSFDTNLWMLRGSLHGEIALSDGTVFSPRLKLSYINERADDHMIVNGSGQQALIRGFASEQLRGSIGFDLTREVIVLGSVVLTPSLGLDVGYAGLQGNGLYAIVKPGFSMFVPGGWSLLGGVQMSFAADGEVSYSVTGSINRQF